MFKALSLHLDELSFRIIPQVRSPNKKPFFKVTLAVPDNRRCSNVVEGDPVLLDRLRGDFERLPLLGC